MSKLILLGLLALVAYGIFSTAGIIPPLPVLDFAIGIVKKILVG